MKILYSLIILLLVACGSSVQKQNNAIVDHYRSLEYPEFSFSPPNPLEYRIELSNGVPVYLYSKSDLPLVTINFTFKENNYPLSQQQTAALELLSTMYRKGGTTSLSPDSVDEKLEFISAQVSGGLSNNGSSIQIDVVSKDVYDVLILARELFLRPGIDSARLAQIKGNYIQNIKHQYDHPATVSRALYAHVMYGIHPINWDIDEKVVSDVTRKEILAEAKGRFDPKNLVIGVAGDFDKSEMVGFLEEYFNGWDQGSRKVAQIEEPIVVSKPGIYIVDKEVSQTHIRMGQPFIKRPHPDYYPATVASYILGSGGFTSRLVSKIRTDEGLAYTVRSYVGSSYDYQKSSGIGLQTKTATAAYAVKLCIDEINKILDEGITDDELARAQNYFIQSIPSIFDTPENSVDFFVMSERNNRDKDHMKQYVQKISAVTKEEVKRVIAKYFNPTNMAITLVGPKKELLKKDDVHSVQLSDFGTITEVKVNDLLVK